MIDARPGPSQYEKPPRLQPTIRSAPKIRQIYWCSFPKDALLPEMWKQRPVVVISRNNKLFEACTVIPTTTDPAEGGTYTVPLTTSLDGRPSFAICNFPVTVATSRLVIHRTGVPRISMAELNEILACLYRWLPPREP